LGPLDKSSVASGLGSVLRAILGLGQLPPSLRCRSSFDLHRLCAWRRAVAFQSGCLVAGRRCSVVSRCRLAVVSWHPLDWGHGVYVGHTVPLLGATTFAVPRRSAGTATRSTVPHRLRLQGITSSVWDCGRSADGIAPLGFNTKSELRFCRSHLPSCIWAGTCPSGRNLCRAYSSYLLADAPAPSSGIPPAVSNIGLKGTHSSGL